jgi:hypothetical protein
MYGTWFAFTLGGVAVLLLVVAAALTAWTPLFALAAFAAIGTVLLVVAAMRRAEEDLPGRETHAGDPERYAAPAGGEGGGGSRGAAGKPDTTKPDQEPEPESAGMWGER